MNSETTLDLSGLSALQNKRQRPVILLAASVLDCEMLAPFFNLLKTINIENELDVVLYGRGGELVAAHRFAHLLRSHCVKINFIVPFHCQSTFTALSLSGDAIIAGDMAMFSAIDPSLNCDGIGALASEDIRMFSDMAKHWFGVNSEQTRTELLSAISGSIFPTTLSSLYRANREAFKIASGLLSLGSPQFSSERRDKIISHLIEGYFSHSYSPTNTEFSELGLPIQRDSEVEDIAWQLAQNVSQKIGRRQLTDTPVVDAIFASSQKALLRQCAQGRLTPEWLELDSVDGHV